MAHTLSIIIPVYNTSAFLEKCVESVLKQNVEMEIILIDDGSTDDSPALCDRLALCDARIKVIHQANSGISSARNRALDICKGKYITFVDSDDRYPAAQHGFSTASTADHSTAYRRRASALSREFDNECLRLAASSQSLHPLLEFWLRR